MARTEQVGSGGASSGRSSGASGARKTRKPRKAAKPRAKRRAASRAKQPSHAKQAASATAPAALHPTGASAWRSVSTSVSPSPLRALASDHALPDVALELVGAQQATLNESLSAALGAWGTARDLAANRAWRRPGGLARMAGL